ncbi:HlyC/CorC family transporter [Methanofollis aquaemaris]|uniref:HlyC/CorC family transporter n=1 Tax=Methanofollis aquaemaris TaxID=126734 RepID=A0A8A3S540_9EURY|nr:hemolysin family protein [Methanofollis aquaemaris]QSZ66746.1 HlyC/CorC family transporter [Methanofollis aquaemaris]
MTPDEIVLIGLFVVCLVMSGFFSSAEVALISITRAKVRTLVNEERDGAEALAQLKEYPDHILITILIGNNVVNVGAASLATAVAIARFGDAGVGIATGVVVILMLVFGEIGPKTYAARYTDRLALFAAPWILLMAKVLYPLLWGYDRFSSHFSLMQGAEPSITEEEIKEWIDVGEEEGTIEEEEREMLYSVFKFGETTAREIMTPRVDVVVIEDTNSMEGSINLFNETGLSRLPVYHDQIDNVVGVLNVKDVFSAEFSKEEASISEMMYDAFFVPESKMIDDLLKEMQIRKVHMAIVLDEYGGFAGVVTVEDILEELVGEILDEFDEEEPAIQKLGGGVYMVDAQVWVEHLNEDLEVALPVGESYETIGGLIFNMLGHLPLRGEVVKLKDGTSLAVMQMRGRRITKVKLIFPPPPAEGGENR